MKTKMITRTHPSGLGELLLGIGLVVVQLCTSPMQNQRETVSDHSPEFANIQKWKVSSQAARKGYQESSGTSHLKGSPYVTFNQS
jgi:hypothetical protein